MIRRFIIVIIVLIQSASLLSQETDSISIFCQQEVIVGKDFPIAIKFYQGGKIDNNITGDYLIESGDSFISDSIINVKKGVGTLIASLPTTGTFELKIHGTVFGKLIKVSDESQIINIGGKLSNDVILSENKTYRIDNDLIIPENFILTVPKGITILLEHEVNIFIHGKINIIGERNNPVVFGSYNRDRPWGGIMLLNNQDTSAIRNCFFINGGSNSNYLFGHSDSQAVIKSENSFLTLNNCYLIDNIGKAFGSQFSIISISECVISRCDTGGEFKNSIVNINNSYITDIPDDSEIYQDEDNDGFYFYGVHSTGQPSIVENCFFICGKDDAIDHNAAKLEINNCWIEDFTNEGIACSNSNWVKVYSTLIKNCGQGIEAGYGTPVVSVDHCILIDNEVGLRFGDGYDWGCSGKLTVTNSITYNNTDNIRNYDILTGQAVKNGILISYSITNDEEYNGYHGCLSGAPTFDKNYQLLSESPGIGKANDQTNIGLHSPYGEVNNIMEYYITCNPTDFDFLYQNYEQDNYIPITIRHEGKTINQARMRIRGSGSRLMPKKSLKIKLDAGTFSDGVDVYNFNAEYEDKSYIQAHVLSKLMNTSGQYCFNSNYVRLFLNDEFLGLYLSVENVDEDFLTKRNLDPNGNLYKATLDGASMSIYDNIYYHWEKKTGSENRDDLQELITTINSVSSEDYYQFTKTHFDYDKMINILAMNLLTRNYSTYYHNYYLYHDINNTGKWVMLPWDLDKAFLYYGYNNHYHRTSRYWTPDNPFLERAILCDPILEDIKIRIDELHRTIINDEIITPMVDSLSLLLHNSVLEDKTDNIEIIEEWLNEIENSKTAFDVRYSNLQYQFNNLPKSFRVQRTKNQYYHTEDILFRWHPTTDPNGHNITYSLFYGTNKNLDDGSATVIRSISDTSHLLTETLDEGIYYWKVVATDGKYRIEGYDNYNLFFISNSEENVVFNEINYNSHLDFNTGDWVELYNNSDLEVDISDWKFQDSDDSHIYFVPQGTVLEPRAYLVLCNELPAFQILNPEVLNCLGNFDFGLSGSGELIRLFNKSGLLVDSVVYDDELPWPVDADGLGHALELTNPSLDNSLASSWVSSTMHGTPGFQNPSNTSTSHELFDNTKLLQNFPNPFCLSTNIEYSINKASNVELVFYSSKGEIVHKTTPPSISPGDHYYVWNTKDISPGIYYYSLKIDGVLIQTNKAIKLQ